jgi:hypothetical protein
LNRRHGDFQSPALPTELPRHFDVYLKHNYSLHVNTFMLNKNSLPYFCTKLLTDGMALC